MLRAFCSIAVLIIVLTPPARAATPVEQKRMQILKSLHAQKYFEYSSCPEVANKMLHKLGLPALGKSAPVKGKRGPFSRSAQLSLPSFQDEITNPEGIKVQIQARPLGTTNPEGWLLHTTRSGQIKLKKGPTPVTMDTDFTFIVENHGGRKTCELTGIVFKIANKPSDKRLKPEQVTIRECIDLFLDKAAGAAKELLWIKSDCAMALHYSAEAKRIVAATPR